LSLHDALPILKCVLLHNESKTNKPPLILVYAFGKRNKTEDHQAMAIIMELIQYHKHGWMNVSDLKVTNLCRGLKLGRPTYVCIYCLWPSRQVDVEVMWTKCWPARSDEAVVGQYSVQCEPAVTKIGKFWAPPLHVLLGVVQIFVKTLLLRRKEAADAGDESAMDRYLHLVSFLADVV